MKTLINQSDRELILARIGKLSPDSSAEWGKMNANQMVCHLTDQLRHALNEKENPMQSNLFYRTLGKWLILYVLPVPKNVPTSPKADQMIGGTKPVGFEIDRKTLLSYVEKLASLPDDFKCGSHFRFGPMNKQQWCIFTYKHADHHLRQFGV